MPFRKGVPAPNKGMLHVSDSQYLAKLLGKATVKPSGCWEMGGFRNKSWGKQSEGYGYMSYRGKNTPAHRLSYFLHHGVHPGKMDVMHKCDNPPCINPDHLQLGTRKENINDALNKGRPHFALIERNRTHCPRGHDYAVYGRRYDVKKPGKRSCSLCALGCTRRKAGWPESHWYIPSQPKGQRPNFTSQRECVK